MEQWATIRGGSLRDFMEPAALVQFIKTLELHSAGVDHYNRSGQCRGIRK